MKTGILQFLSGTKRVNKRRILAAFVAILFGASLNAQVSSYTFSASAGTYTPITGGTVLGVPNNDDTSFPNNPIGFPFCFNGITYTAVGINSNGWLEMGPNAAMNNSYTALSGGIDNNIVAANNHDIQGDATLGELRYQTIGTAPNRTFVVQWKDYDDYQSAVNNDVYNFQIRLNESGSIEVVYGTFTSVGTNLAEVGLRGASSADYNNLQISNGLQTWATPIAGTSNAVTCEHGPGLDPASGQTFTWTQPAAPAIATSATFTGVTSTAMTLNWVDNSTNEATFVVQRSLDNITFTTVTTIASTSIATTGTGYNYVATNLYNNTLYYWRVYATNANCGSSFLAAQQSTLPGTMCGTYTVGPTGAYTSLTAAFAAVATNGVSCPLVFDLQAAYVSTVETFPINIPFLGNGPTSTITVRPELGATNLSITSASTQTIAFNGAQYINFDGRPGSLGTVSHLTIENTSTTGNAIQYVNDGAYNGLNYCIIRGVNTSTVSGVVLFSTAVTGGIGNSYNSITNCELRDGATTPTNLVYASNGTANVFNTGNTFTGNIFHDWFSASSANNAIFASTGNTAWTISNNSFYQTATRTYISAVTYYIVNLATGSGTATGGHTISGNYFGGTAALCGGTAYTTAGAVAHRFIVLQTTTGTGGANSIQGNTIRNFNHSTTSGATTVNGVWCGINTTGTNAANNIGTITPNVIGSNTANAQIVTSVTTTGGLTVGYNNSASGAQNFSNNIIGGITANSSSITTSSSIVAIQTSSGTMNTISGNIIGSVTQLSSLINAASTGTSAGQVTGIVCSALNSSLPGNQITNNTVMNLTNQYAGTSTGGFVRGIATTSGINTITGNTIANLSNMSPQTGTTTAASVIGIAQASTSSGANQTVAQNTISNLVNLSLTGAVNVNAIVVTGTTLNQTLVYRNSIIGIGSASSGAAVMNGINIIGGTCRVYNNFVNIGVDATGASLTLSHEFNGINKNVTNRATVAFNTVNIGGTGVGAGTANSSAFRRISSPTVTPSDSVYSNIFANFRSNGASTGTHYAININNTTNYVANGNNYYGNGTGYVLGNINATTYNSISTWQVASAQDANSFAVNPNFTSATNLHINNATQSVLESRAVVMNINTDIDNDVRPGPVASVNGGGTAPDIGADEFDGIPVNVDVSVTTLANPLSTGCHTACELIRVRLYNTATVTLNMAINPVTINASVTGPNPATFGPLVISSGTIAAGGFIDTTIFACYDMTALGTFVFNAVATTPSDVINSNDAMAPLSITNSGGTAAANRPSICFGDSALITLSGATNGGTIQWQSSPDNLVWTNIVGATTNPLSTGPLSDTTFFRALVCGVYTSVSDTVGIPYIAPPVTVNDTICGAGSVTLSATGSGLQWYDAPTGGNLVNSGATYTTPLTTTTTFYVASSSGTPPSIHTTTFAAGNGSNGNMFTITAINTVTITGFDGHVTSGSSDWRIDYRPDNYLLVPGANTSAVGWIPLGTATGVPAAGTGLPTPIPIPFSVTIPAGQTYSFHVMTTAGSTVQYTNGTGAGNVYNSNVDFQFREGHGGVSFNCTNVPRVFNGRIHYTAGCEGGRTAVTGFVDPAPVVSVTSSNNICGNGSSTLVASSPNPQYVYTWTPPATLNVATGDTVVASPLTTTTYLVTGTDVATGCVDTASVSVMWALPPQVMASASPDTICSGATDSLNAQATFTNPTIVGTGNTINTSTGYPAPYGNFYWGSRHQMLITAADLTAAGLTPGFISALTFEITNTNATSPLDNFEIKLGSTTAASLTAFYTGTMTSVYTSTSYVPTTGLNTHTFTTQYYWDGVSDLIVETCHNNTAFNTNCSFRQDATAYTSTVYYRADAAGVCGNNSVTASIAQRPNMRFSRSTAAWQYGWTPTASLNNPAIANPVATPLITTDYVLTVTDSVSGCISMDTVTVTVNPTPAPSFGPDTSVCSNTVLLLDGTAGPYTYLWQDSTVNQTYSVNVFGNYSVVVTDSVTGCAGTDTILVGIDAAPSFTLGSDATVCAGTQVSFSGPSGQYSYMWNTADTTVSILTGTAGSYDVAVTDTVNGCTSMDTVILSVNPVPVVALGSDTAICSVAGAITLSGPAGNYEYLWSTSDTTQTISVNSTATYYVTVTDTATSCSSGDTIQVVYNTSPVVTLGNDTTFCSNNGPITLVATAGPYNYVWNDNSTLNTLTTNVSGMYYVDLTDSITGCTATDSILVNVPANPTVTLSDTAFCGTDVTLNGPAGPFSYLWSTSDTTQSLFVTVSGTYSLTVTDTTSGCAGSDSSIVNVNANPVVTAAASNLAPCVDDANVVLTGVPTGGVFTGTSVTGTQFDPSVGAGSYSIIYNFTDVNGCSGADTITIAVNACVGINDPFAGAGMNVYPNPNSGIFTFTAANQACNEMTIEVMTIEGQVVKSNMHSNVQGNFTEEINMTEFANGVYIMRVTTDGAVFTQRIVKQD